MDIPLGDHYYQDLILLNIIKTDLAPSAWITFFTGVGGIILLLVCSALVSASETALFSLSPQTMHGLRDKEDKRSQTILNLLYHHKKLLATILIANNFVNVGIVFLSTFLFTGPSSIFDFTGNPLFGFLMQAVIVTIILVFFGEVFPKVYATANNLKISLLMSIPLFYLSRVLAPFVYLLEKSSLVLDKRMGKKGHQFSIDELNQAIDITSSENQSEEEKDILKGIVNFGNITVKQIMHSRMDVMALEINEAFADIIEKLKSWGYSRIPVYEENFDNIKGILYIKDLVPHLQKEDYNWQETIRSPYFVPESKKLDDLLSEFQEKHVHMAIVVDEYGGTSGIITMEDVLEEIFGEINDEFDEDDFSYSKLDDYNFIFEGKALIHDVCRLTEIEPSVFDDVKGEAETLGGMLVEKQGRIPTIGSRIRIYDFEFLIESADKRRIKRVKMTIPQSAKADTNE